jgi:selenocysteine lyase/cysteine desulfurase
VNPAAEVGRVAREGGVPFLLDACQSVGQMPVDVEAIGCDFLSASARKFLRGPRGIGFLYVRRAALAGLEPPFLDLRAATWTGERDYRIRPDARRFENWETNYAAKLGLGAAVDYALGWGLDQIGYWVAALAAVLRERLGSIPGVTVRDLGEERCGIVTFTVDGTDPVVLKMALEAEDMNVAVSTRAATYLDMTARGLDAIVRASVHYYNTEQEIARFCSTVERLTA